MAEVGSDKFRAGVDKALQSLRREKRQIESHLHDIEEDTELWRSLKSRVHEIEDEIRRFEDYRKDWKL